MWDLFIITIYLNIHCFRDFLDKSNKLIFLPSSAKESWVSVVDLAVCTTMGHEKATKAKALPPGTPQTCPRAKAAASTRCFIYLAILKWAVPSKGASIHTYIHTTALSRFLTPGHLAKLFTHQQPKSHFASLWSSALWAVSHNKVTHTAVIPTRQGKCDQALCYHI